MLVLVNLVLILVNLVLSYAVIWLDQKDIDFMLLGHKQFDLQVRAEVGSGVAESRDKLGSENPLSGAEYLGARQLTLQIQLY